MAGVGVGIVGLTPARSWSARTHLLALRALPDFDVVAVANSYRTARASLDEATHWVTE